MILLDSNVIVNSTKVEYDYLRQYLADQTYCISVVSQIEVLGFHKLSAEDKHDFGELFSRTPILTISDEVVREAIRLRQLRKIGLGDAVIAATAIVHKLEFVTFNTTKDFKCIDNLNLLNPAEVS
jgi:predicted nucleic acid-binding protein